MGLSTLKSDTELISSILNPPFAKGGMGGFFPLSLAIVRQSFSGGRGEGQGEGDEFNAFVLNPVYKEQKRGLGRI